MWKKQYIQSASYTVCSFHITNQYLEYNNPANQSMSTQMASKVVPKAVHKLCSRWQFVLKTHSLGGIIMATFHSFFPRNKVQPLLYTVPQQKSLIMWEGITLTTAARVSHQRKLRIQKQLLSFGNWVKDLSGRLHWMKHRLWTCDWWSSSLQ